MNYALAYLHYIALALGFGSVWLRGHFLRRAKTGDSPNSILSADNFWGIASLLWIVTGLLRAFAGYEKGTLYYLQNPWFWIKMSLFLLIFCLEIWPMVTFIRWRIKKKHLLMENDLPRLKVFSVFNGLQMVLVLMIPFFAVLMARRGFF